MEQLNYITCQDLEDQGEWNTVYCCSVCHDEIDEDHRLEVESVGGELILGCIPLFEHLIYGSRIEDTSA